MERQKQYWTYRIIGSINIFVAIFFLFLIFLGFLGIGFNRKLVFASFIWICVLIYTTLSVVFARYVMAEGNFIRPKLKEWIKVNAFVTVIFATIVLISFSLSLIETAVIQQVSKKISVPVNWLYNSIFIFIGCMALLIVHVLLTFHYLKQFNSHFRDPEEEQQGFKDE